MPVTPGTLPVAGHASKTYIEVDPTAQGVFTIVSEVTSSIDFGTTRQKTDITPHGAGVDSYIVAQIIGRDDLTLDITYKFADTVHAALHDHYMSNTIFGLMILGPEGTQPSTDCVIQSGQITTWKQMGPVRNGEYKAQLVFRASGPMKVNGTLYS